MNSEQIGEMLALLFTGLSMLLFVIGVIEMVSCFRKARAAELEIQFAHKKSSSIAHRGNDIADKTFLSK